jgi:hypothetical protein
VKHADPEARRRIIDAVGDAIDPHMDDMGGYNDGGEVAYDEVIVPLLAKAWDEGYNEALAYASDELAYTPTNPYREESE